MSQLSDAALQVAISQIGKEENPRGSNWGKTGDPVPMYLASVGINFPASWCMAFVYWCFITGRATVVVKQAGYAFPIATGGVLDQWSHAFLHTQIDVASPQIGDIFIMDLGHGLGHTGIIESISADGTLHTIEGNTNDTGSREGYEVARKTRKPQKPIIGYLRY